MYIMSTDIISMSKSPEYTIYVYYMHKINWVQLHMSCVSYDTYVHTFHQVYHRKSESYLKNNS